MPAAPCPPPHPHTNHGARLSSAVQVHGALHHFYEMVAYILNTVIISIEPEHIPFRIRAPPLP